MKQLITNNGLRLALLSNAVFSMISALILLLIPSFIAELFGIANQNVFLIVGGALMYFSATIVYESQKQRVWAVRWIVLQDYIWVAASTFLLIARPFDISIAGNFIIAVIAAIVLFMGVWQSLQLQAQHCKLPS